MSRGARGWPRKFSASWICRTCCASGCNATLGSWLWLRGQRFGAAIATHKIKPGAKLKTQEIFMARPFLRERTSVVVRIEEAYIMRVRNGRTTASDQEFRKFGSVIAVRAKSGVPGLPSAGVRYMRLFSSDGILRAKRP